MAWTVPAHTRTEVDAAGQALIPMILEWRKDNDALNWDVYLGHLSVMENWRASHSYPLNIFQNNLRAMSKVRGIDCTVAQRLKREISIFQKLEALPNMRLSQMQDIGGCRAILGDVAAVTAMKDALCNSRMRHQLSGIDDYIQKPRESGYRGIHLKYRYHSDRNETYNGLRIEIQLRTLMQHFWATGVETVGTFTDQALKASKGRQDWLRFFALMGSFMAHRENCPLVSGTPDTIDNVIAELRVLCGEMDAIGQLEGFGRAMKVLEDPESGESKYYVLELNSATHETTIHPYTNTQLKTATEHYSKLETLMREQMDLNAVLVSVDSLGALRKAYPNYFLDTHAFLGLVREAVF